MPTSFTPTSYPGDVLNREGVRSAGEELVRILEAGRRPTLQLDLSGVLMPTAAGIGELVALQQRLWEMGGKLALCNVNCRTFEAFAAVGLTGVFGVQRGGYDPSYAPRP